MTTVRRSLVCAGLASLLLARIAVAQDGATFPGGAPSAARDPVQFAWWLFGEINRNADDPALRTGRPDADGPVTWETWMNAAQVFLDDGVDPGPWRNQDPWPGVADASRFTESSLKSLPNLRHIVDGRMVPVEEDLPGERELTEVRMNRPAYEYVRVLGLYCIEGQLAAAGSVAFPAQAVEVKAHWRRIGDVDRARYHVVEVRSKAGKVELYGLSALHIASKALPHWFWATFEHVGNQASALPVGQRARGSDRLACNGPPGCGPAPGFVDMLRAPWTNYRLRGTMTDYVDARGTPVLLANPELERGFESTSSCITCHARSSIGVVDGAVVRLPVFRSVELHGNVIVRTGYVGIPEDAWFYEAARPGDPWMRPLDAVWSLSLAKHRKSS
jgi:hypothetical protein